MGDSVTRVGGHHGLAFVMGVLCLWVLALVGLGGLLAIWIALLSLVVWGVW